jgi:peptidoglycan/xylan/chitin deacetylase (PgdA/CDA1 family)
MHKKAYLTIDDSPSKDFRVKIDFLYRHNIPAILFCIGEKILEYPDDVVYAIQRGFVIGNHSMTHPHFSDLYLEDCYHEIGQADAIIEDIYQKAGSERTAKYFRFPYFDPGGDLNSESYESKQLTMPRHQQFIYPNDEKRLAIQSFLRIKGYRQPKFEGLNTHWYNEYQHFYRFDIRCTFDQKDYWLGQANAPDGLDKAEAILARIDANYIEEGRTLNDPSTTDIILVHDHDYTTELFYKIIDRYLEKKIEFISAG